MERQRLVSAVLVLAFVTVTWFARPAAIVLAPIAFAFFVALVVHPISARVRDITSARRQWLGPMAAMGIVLAVLLLFVAAVGRASAQVAGELPRYAERIDERVARLARTLPLTDMSSSGNAERSNGSSGNAGS